MVEDEGECEAQGCAYLLRILLNEDFVLELDLCQSLLPYDRRKADQKRRGCDSTDNIFSDFCGALEERRCL